MADTEKHTHGEQDALVKQIFELLDARVQANAYADDGSYANQIRTLPRGLRAMAATHHLDVSLTLDDIGWHFLNFGERGLVDETELGLRELGLSDVAAMFREAFELLEPHLAGIHVEADYRRVLRSAGCEERIDELTDRARAAIGKDGIYRHWVAYARNRPSDVFDVH